MTGFKQGDLSTNFMSRFLRFIGKGCKTRLIPVHFLFILRFVTCSVTLVAGFPVRFFSLKCIQMPQLISHISGFGGV